MKNGVLDTARFIPSPNCDARDDEADISLLVIHSISLPPGKFGGNYVQALFTNQLQPDAHPYFQEIYQLKVSAHLFIRRNGDIVQFVPFHQRAWHAGKSNFRGQHRCNDFSIGIELEGCDYQAFTPVQYEQLISITTSLMHYYPQITADRICGHQHIAYKRKTDPGPEFNWSNYLLGLKESPLLKN
ncbi:MAG: 1,6-anhydro-N-acetylmuramyl-L-alanine amidase AmpD [Pseudomonadales bacterium]|nr:1,6-anhydro-N-acetylmuramyl-L-alanine amidase AmpD [Pseudomonadales bacterium]